MSDPNPHENYPAPHAQAPGLPFYHPVNDDRQRQHDEQDDGRQQDDGAMEGDSSHEMHQQVSDDPALRSQLASMIGSFAMQQQHQPTNNSSSIPPNPFTSRSAHEQDSAPPSAERQKQARTKTSRACDECRRKKIRCDAVDESGNTACSQCARSGATCAFSRLPMKRGPSKGYIKELAERIGLLEKHTQPGAMHPEQQMELQRMQREMAESLRASGEGSFALDPRVGDKRTHAVAEMVHTPGANNSPARFAPMPPTYPPSGYAPPAHMQDTMQQPFWRHGGNENRPENTALSYDADNSTAITSFDWDETVIDEYYRIIHQTFPLLPNNKNRLRQGLASCPASLREAFLVALDCLMRTFPTTTLQPNANYAQAVKKAAELLAKYPFDNPSTHTNATNLVYLQTLLLMALESDNHGPATIRGQAGPSRAEWLGRAAGVAGQLEINVIRTQSQSVMDGDRDSEERMARRVWWVLFILDRWHASSTADLLKLPENSVVLLPEDQILLGESTYHLARLSFIIGHLAAILTTTKTPSTDVMAPGNPASSLLGLTLAGEIDRFRESVESVWGSLNLVHLSYHHCHLLIKRLSPTTEPSEIVGHATKVATVLNSRLTPVTPLNHHFGALAAMTLCELCDVPKTRSEALKGLEHLVEALGEGRGLAGKSESEGWDGAVRELVVKKMERMQSLHGLADAVAAEGEGGGERRFEPTMLTRYGYLTALGQGMFRSA